jgi:Xaa-Pro dipeptidase
MRLGEEFYRRKIDQVQEISQRRALDGLLLLNHHQIYYLVGFFHYPTERPVALFVPQRGEPTLFVPKLEESYVHEGAWAPDVRVYFEFPGMVHPLDWVAQQLHTRNFGSKRIGFESSISISARERLVKALPNVIWVDASDLVSGMRLVKEPEEIALMRKAAFYSDWMLSEGVGMVKSGTRYSEIEIEQAMVSGVITKMQRELDPVVAVPGLAGALVCSGPRSAFPHGLPTARRIAPGENLILCVACFVGG